MKKLCGKGSVHPWAAIKGDEEIHLLSLLPVAILSLVAALSAEDREVLAYLISNSGSGDPNRLKKNKTQLLYHHHPLFNCDCFSCYTSYWVRWDSSPNRQLIHQIIDAFEDSLEMKTKNTHKKSITPLTLTLTPPGKKDRRKRSGKPKPSSVHAATLHSAIPTTSKHFVGATPGCSASVDERGAREEPSKEEKGSVDRLMSFIALKFFGVWG